MSKARKTIIAVQGTEITVIVLKEGDYISLTDMLKAKDGDFFISDWLRNRNAVEFLGIWERVHNPAFNYGEFAIIKSNAGLKFSSGRGAGAVRTPEQAESNRHHPNALTACQYSDEKAEIMLDTGTKRRIDTTRDSFGGFHWTALTQVATLVETLEVWLTISTEQQAAHNNPDQR